MPSSTRSICFVERAEFDITGTLSPFGIALGDADNDGDNELVAGNVDGQLFIFKASSARAWRTAFNLGFIVCVGIGDILNQGKNCVLTVSCEGCCHAFDLTTSRDENLTSIHSQTDIGINIKLLLIDDIDNDGNVELVIGYTDKFVRAFRWSPNFEDDLGNKCPGFKQVYGWRLARMIGTLSMVCCDGERKLAVAQPGNNYAILETDDQSRKSAACSSSFDSISHGAFCSANGTVLYRQITGERARDTETNCGILGNISRGCSDQPTITGTVTQDGNIYLHQLKSDGSHRRILSLCVNDYHLLPHIHKFDITGEGREEVVVCALNGMTYIIDHFHRVVRFQFQEDVLAFVAGEYSIKPTKTAPCLVYATFNNKIMLYYNIRLPRLQSVSLRESMLGDDEVRDELRRRGILDKPLEQKKLYHRLIYHTPDALISPSR